MLFAAMTAGAMSAWRLRGTREVVAHLVDQRQDADHATASEDCEDRRRPSFLAEEQSDREAGGERDREHTARSVAVDELCREIEARATERDEEQHGDEEQQPERLPEATGRHQLERVGHVPQGGTGDEQPRGDEEAGRGPQRAWNR